MKIRSHVLLLLRGERHGDTNGSIFKRSLPKSALHKKSRIVFHHCVPPSCHYYAASTTDVLTLNTDALLVTALNFCMITALHWFLF
jgi:hypothetical protein